MFGFKKEPAPANEAQADSGSDAPYVQNVDDDPLANTGKNRWEKIWPAMACGAGLFSDGYVNNVIKLPAATRKMNAYWE